MDLSLISVVICPKERCLTPDESPAVNPTGPEVSYMHTHTHHVCTSVRKTRLKAA